MVYFWFILLICILYTYLYFLNIGKFCEPKSIPQKETMKNNLHLLVYALGLGWHYLAWLRFTWHLFGTGIYSSPHGCPLIFFIPISIKHSSQMSHFRIWLVFRETHSSVLLNLKVKMHTSIFLSTWEIIAWCVTCGIKVAWLIHLHSYQLSNFSSQSVQTWGKKVL